MLLLSSILISLYSPRTNYILLLQLRLSVNIIYQHLCLLFLIESDFHLRSIFLHLRDNILYLVMLLGLKMLL